MQSLRLLTLLFLVSLVACNKETLPDLEIAHTGKGTVQIDVLEGDQLKIRYSTSPRSEHSSRSVLPQATVPGEWEVTRESQTGNEAFTKGNWTVGHLAEDGTLIVLFDGDTLFAEASAIAHTLRPDSLYYDRDSVSFVSVQIGTQAGEQFFGAGPRAIPQNLRGRTLEVYNQPHFGYANGTPNLNITIPWVLSSEGYGIYFDSENPAVLDLASTDSEVWEYEVEATEALTYYILPGNLAKLPQKYVDLTGHQPLPPRWAMGFIQSRYGYETEEQARNVVDSMQLAGFPLDGLVLDLQWFGGTEDMGNMDWDRERFPTPEQMIQDFAATGVKVIPILEPYFTRESTNFDHLDEQGWLAKTKEGNSYVIEDFWTGGGGAGLLDLYNTETHDWFWSFFEARTREGAAAWWCDLGEPENHPIGMNHVNGPARVSHNGYSLIWADLLYRKYQEVFPEVRLFNLIRSGYGGMQRYSTFPWSGDISRSWSGYQAQIPVMLGAGLSGIGYMSSDLGGFTGGEQNDELYTRWLQFGAFTPIMRAHGSNGIPSEPIYYTQQTQDIVRKYVKLRYAFLPYNYTLAWENTTEGTPLVRPLWYHYPEVLDTYTRQDEYLWGESLLIAPVLEAGKTEREVFFPTGTWYSYWDDEKISGNTSQTVTATLDQMPIFIKEGTILTTTEEELFTTDAYSASSLRLDCWLMEDGSNFSGQFYHDDGKNPQALAGGNFDLISWQAEESEGELKLKAEREHNAEAVACAKELHWVVHDWQNAPSEVLWDETPLSASTEMGGAGTYFVDAKNHLLHVWVTWEEDTRTLIVR
ncbi:MAG: TIM-barrel domain-containing protein [Bacteroidota bacterium]